MPKRNGYPPLSSFTPSSYHPVVAKERSKTPPIRNPYQKNISKVVDSKIAYDEEFQTEAVAMLKDAQSIDSVALNSQPFVSHESTKPQLLERDLEPVHTQLLYDPNHGFGSKVDEASIGPQSLEPHAVVPHELINQALCTEIDQTVELVPPVVAPNCIVDDSPIPAIPGKAELPDLH
jgi:hypothetical protein